MSAHNPNRSRATAYWIFTLLIAAGLIVGGTLDLLHTAYVRAIIDHIGYPAYILFILGVWKLLGAVAILVPGYRLLKEWAYAGGFFVYSGAVASHLLSGDGLQRWAAPAVLGAILIASWAWRPANRRLNTAA
jgi:hypothetical protein